MDNIKITIRHFPDRKKPCLTLEWGNKGIVLASFKNAEMVRLYITALGGNNTIQFMGDITSIEELIKEMGYG